MERAEDKAHEVQGSTPTEAVAYLRSAIGQGQPWHRALLEAMALWSIPEETYQTRHFRYLLDGEAFDWPLLAERLCLEVDGLIPAEGREQLLQQGRLPEKLSERELRELLGPTKYRAYLNYWYGVVLEQALQQAVEEEVRKERLSRGLSGKLNVTEETCARIYGAPRSELLQRFCQEKGRLPDPQHSQSEVKEFTYWLFKYRLRNSDSARLASDTRKGLERLQGRRGA